MSDVFSLIDQQAGQFLAELQDFLRIPSISTLPEHKGDIQRAAEWAAEKLRAAGMTEVQVHPTPGHPIVYGAWSGAPGAPTVLIYGHYDVQPVDPIDEWRTDPFGAAVEGNYILARGSSDDKGQVFANIKAVAALMQAHGGKLPVNVKFLIEGEEEIGGANLDPFIHSHLDLLRCDVAIVSDTAILSVDQPAVIYGLRGLVYLELEVRGPDHDLHSGQYGGSVHNPLQALCEIVTALHHPDGSVAVEGFYDKVRLLDSAEREAMAQVPFTETVWKAQTGAPAPWGEADYTLRERVGARPTLEVNGIVGGFTGHGSKTVLPAKGMAKISGRLVPDQDPYEIEKLIRAYVAKITPPTVTSEVRALSHGHGAMVPIGSPATQAAVRAYERGFGRKPVFMREGGSIPVVATLSRAFDIPVLLVGYGLPDDGLHGPNERFHVQCFYRGIKTAAALLEELATARLKE
jgi:acetylornithine deacetylase/succinyl-diaminopimelate desuccinylase-like protein